MQETTCKKIGCCCCSVPRERTVTVTGGNPKANKLEAGWEGISPVLYIVMLVYDTTCFVQFFPQPLRSTSTLHCHGCNTTYFFYSQIERSRPEDHSTRRPQGQRTTAPEGRKTSGAKEQRSTREKSKRRQQDHRTRRPQDRNTTPPKGQMTVRQQF